MTYSIDDFVNSIKMLLPKGRAFNFTKNSDANKLIRVIASIFKMTYDDVESIYNSIIPDNENFDIKDIRNWEYVYGILSKEDVPLSDRRQALLRKFRYPADILERQGYQYLEAELRYAGFDVYCHDNRYLFDGEYVTLDPNQNIVSTSVLNTFELNEQPLGGSSFTYTKIVNYIEEGKDSLFPLNDLRRTFFVGNSSVYDYNATFPYANVLESRKDEFRNLILTIKPVHSIGVMFINYISYDRLQIIT